MPSLRIRIQVKAMFDLQSSGAFWLTFSDEIFINIHFSAQGWRVSQYLALTAFCNYLEFWMITPEGWYTICV